MGNPRNICRPEMPTALVNLRNDHHDDELMVRPHLFVGPPSMTRTGVRDKRRPVAATVQGDNWLNLWSRPAGDMAI